MSLVSLAELWNFLSVFCFHLKSSLETPKLFFNVLRFMLDSFNILFCIHLMGLVLSSSLFDFLSEKSRKTGLYKLRTFVIRVNYAHSCENAED